MATRFDRVWHRLLGALEPPSRAEVWLILTGIVLRAVSFLLLLPQELDPDAGNYRLLAVQFSWSGPLGAGYGEPLWMALVKLVIAPFDYSPVVYRLFTTLLSILVVVLSWVVFKRLLSPTARLFALGFVALNGLLVFIAPRGLREELVTSLLLVGALSLVKLYRDGGRGWGVIMAIAAVSLVRLEIGLFLIVVLGMASIKVAPLRRLVAAGTFLSVVLVAPWLISNAHGLGDPLNHSNASATFFRNADLVDMGFPTQPLKVETTWPEYYLHFLGPVETVKRLIIGIPSLIGSLFYNSFLPIRPSRILESLPSLRSYMGLVRLVAGMGALVVLGVTLVGLTHGRPRRVLWIGMMFALLGIAAYAPLSRHLTVNYRLIAFTVPFVAALFGSGAEVVLDWWHRRRGSAAI